MIWFDKSFIKFCKSFVNLISSLVHWHAALPALVGQPAGACKTRDIFLLLLFSKQNGGLLQLCKQEFFFSDSEVAVIFCLSELYHENNNEHWSFSGGSGSFLML